MIARVHATAAASRANGPGRRFVVWFQGCTLGCAGCFNPATHVAAGPVVDLAEVIAAFDAASIEFGGLDILVSNAGIASAAPLEDTSLALWPSA